MSDIKKKADEFSAKLEARLESSKRQSEIDLDSFLAHAPYRGDEVEARIRQYDAELTRRIQQAQQKFGIPIAPAKRVDLTATPELLRVDKTFVELFQLKKYLLSADMRYPTVFCETLDEFFAPWLDAYDLSPAQKAQALADMKAEAEKTAQESNGGGIFGVNLPGQGCYLNGWLFNYRLKVNRPRDLLNDPKILPRILETAAHEKLGHGFILEFTALGAEKKTLGLQMLDYAHRFKFKMVDTPAASLLLEKHNLVHRATKFTEEGWATWIETTIMQVMAHQPRAPKYTFRAVWDTATRLPVPRDEKERFQAALQILFLQPDSSWDAAHASIVALQIANSAIDDYFFKNIGQPVPYVIGSLLFDKLESRFGTLPVLYALMIAASVTFDLRNISSSDLARLIITDPKLNPDSRLAGLGTLTIPVQGDVRALADAARQQLGLATPAELSA